LAEVLKTNNMGFKLRKKSIIQGTAGHRKDLNALRKESALKNAEDYTVPRTRADQGLINQAYRYGQSIKPKPMFSDDVDYSIDFDFPGKDDDDTTIEDLEQKIKDLEAKLEERNDDPDDDDGDGGDPVRGCTNPEADNYNRNATEDDGSCTKDGQPMDTDVVMNIPGGGEGTLMQASQFDQGLVNILDRKLASPDGFNSIYGKDSAMQKRDEEYTGELEKRQGLGPRAENKDFVSDLETEKVLDSIVFSGGQGVEILPKEKRDQLRKDIANMTPSERARFINERKNNSPAQKRDDRIYENARKNSILRKNMEKRGYIPRELR